MYIPVWILVFGLLGLAAMEEAGELTDNEEDDLDDYYDDV